MNYLDIVLSLILAVLTGFIIPLITNKLGEQKAARIEKWAGIFVNVAEQTNKGAGADKRKEVMEKLISMFDEDVDELSDIMESQVFKMNKDLTEKK